MKKYKADKARYLRNWLARMLFSHILFTFLEVFYFHIMWSTVLPELLYMWVCFQSYMTLSRRFCWVYIVLMCLAPLSGLFNVQEIYHEGGFLQALLYIAQLGF